MAGLVSTEVIVTVITTLGAVFVAVVSSGIKKSNQSTSAAVVESVAKLASTMQEVQVTDKRQTTDIADLRADQALLAAQQDRLTAAIEALTVEVRSLKQEIHRLKEDK